MSLRRILVPAIVLVACSTTPDTTESTPTGSVDIALNATGTWAEVYVVLSGPSAIDAVPTHLHPADAAAATHVRRRLAAMDTERSALAPALAALDATVVADIRRLANLVQVRVPTKHLAKLARLPSVLGVERVPLLERSLGSAVPVVGGPEVWARTTPITGKGLTIGIIDSGIDYMHADFGGVGTAAAFKANDPKVIEAGSFPTAKVVGGFDFVGDDYNPGPQGQGGTPQPDPDPIDCFKAQSMQVAGGHGTHVAGIAAGIGVLQSGATFTGSYAQSFDPSLFRVAPGVAPEAKLFALKIFGCEGGTTQLASALERAVDPNQDGNLSDRLDVVNASLGTAYAVGSAGGVLVRNLTKAGSLLVVAAGNDGQTFWATGSPSVYPDALSVAASVDADLVALQVKSPATVAGDYAAAEGGFTTRLLDSGAVSAKLVASAPVNGCQGFSNASAISGNVAFIDRGSCTFVQKFNNAIAAGAVAAIIVDNEDNSLPFAMSGGDPGSVSIPGVMIRKVDGDKIRTQLAAGVNVVLDPVVKFSGAGSEVIASFSSRGPSAIDGILKPEISAPGFSIDSARVGSGTLARRSQGTSMASPVVAGAAALVRQAQPTWTPAEIKAALMNSAEPATDGTLTPYPPSIAGAGRVAVERAVDTTFTALSDEASASVAVSFGALISDEKATKERPLSVKNHGSQEITVDLALQPLRTLPGVSVAITPTQLTIAPGASESAKLTLSLDPEALGAPEAGPATPTMQFENPRHYLVEADGWVKLSSGTETSVVPYHGVVRAAAQRKALALPECAETTPGVITVPIGGTSAHPKPVVTAFQLGALSARMPASDTNPEQAMLDLLAVGAATDISTAETFDDAGAFIGVAVAGEWTTAARGALSLINVAVDTNFDGQAEFVIRAEPLTSEGPYADVLTSTTYRLSNSQPLGRRFLNMVSVETAKTEPFYSSVLVLATDLKDLDLTPGATKFAYAVVTQAFDLGTQADQTEWITFDPEAPELDTAILGEEGRPVFQGDEVRVQISDAARESQTVPDLLLLHHNNLPGERFEIVKLSDELVGTGDLVVKSTPLDDLTAGQTALWKFQVFNEGNRSVDNVSVAASVKGAKIVTQATSRGSCSIDDGVSCDLGTLAPGEGAEVHVGIEASGSASSVILSAVAPDAKPCESDIKNNSLEVSVAVTGAGTTTAALSPSGGCGGCAVPQRGQSDAPLWLALSALGLAGLRRRAFSKGSGKIR